MRFQFVTHSISHVCNLSHVLAYVVVVLVYHVAIVAIENVLLKKFWPLVLMVEECVLRTAGSSFITQEYSFSPNIK